MRRFFVFILIVAIIAIPILYLVSQPILEVASQALINYIFTRDDAFMPGAQIERPTFGSVRLTSFNAVSWYNVLTGASVRAGVVSSKSSIFTIKVERATVVIRNPFKLSFLLRLRGLRVKEEEGAATTGLFEGARDRLAGYEVDIPFELQSLSPESLQTQMRYISYNLVGFMTRGKTNMPVEFSGETTFIVQGKPVKVRLGMTHEGGQNSLVMDRNQLLDIARQMGEEELTDAEVDLVSRNPLQAPEILRITNYARQESQKAHREDSYVPEDAYRHVLWSFLLTKSFGASFAKEITDAHEEGAAMQTEQDKRMDLNNNAVGRRYAQRGYSEGELLNLVMNDPDVIR